MKCSVHPSSNKGPSALMDACVWSNLPQDLLDRVLAFLPLKSLLRLRCVCRRWCLLVRTPRFLAVRSNISCYDPWLLMFKRQDYGICRAFEESNCKWHRMGLSFLPYRVRDVLAAASSLLCFGTDDPESLIVCNPLTKTWKALPPMRCRRSQGVVGMAVNRKINMYNIIVARDVSHEHSRRTEVYDSRVNEWKITSALPPKTLLRRDTVLWNGILYLLSVEPFKLLAYDFAKETWCNLPALFPGSLIFSSLVLSQNILFLVGGVGSNGISKTVYIWQMTAAKVEWKEVDRMPDNMCKRFLASSYHNYDHISCIGQGDLIHISCYTWPEAVVYNAYLRSWRWIPRCPEVPAKSSGGFMWFPFDPNFDVSV